MGGDDEKTIKLNIDEILAEFRKENGLPQRPPTCAPAEKKAAPKTMREIVEAALADDAAHRYKGVKDGLVKFEELKLDKELSFETWDNSVPVVVPGRTYVPVADRASFENNKSAFWQCLEGFALMNDTGKGLVVAGGAVAHALTAINYHLHDIDCFLVGLSEEEAIREIQRLAEHLSGKWPNMKVARTERCLTFYDEFKKSEPMVQVVLRLYGTVSEVLHGFDFGSCAVAYTGRDLLFTGLGRLAYERGVNIIDLTRRRCSYERRLVKYSDRGWAIVMPDLKVPVRPQMQYYYNAVELSGVRFWPTEVTGSVVRVSSMSINSDGILALGRLSRDRGIDKVPTVETAFPEVEKKRDVPVETKSQAEKKDHGSVGDSEWCVVSVPGAQVDAGRNYLNPAALAMSDEEINKRFPKSDAPGQNAAPSGSKAGPQDLPDDGDTSEYGDGHAYRDSDKLLMKNFLAAKEPFVRTAKLVAVAAWNKDVDVTKIRVDFSGLGRCLKSLGIIRKEGRLKEMVGVRATAKIIEAAIRDDYALCVALGEALANEVQDRAELPFKFGKIEHDTLLKMGGAFPAAYVTPSEWYGRVHFNDPAVAAPTVAAPTVAASGSLLQLLRPFP